MNMYNIMLDPRDNKIHVDFHDAIYEIKNNIILQQCDPNKRIRIGKKNLIKQKIRQWLNKVFQTITSDAFFRLNSGQLTEGQTKAYAAKNYIYNIKPFMEAVMAALEPQGQKAKDTERLKQCNKAISIKMFKDIDKMSNQIIQQIIMKYPQSQAKAGTKKLKEKIKITDNSQKEEYDLLRYPSDLKVNFMKNQNQDYHSEIMIVLNEVIQISNKKLVLSAKGEQKQQSALTNFQFFALFLKKILKNTHFSEDEKLYEEKQTYNGQTMQNTNVTEIKKINQIIQQLEKKKNNDQKEDKVKEKVNAKISSNVKTFKQDQIKSKTFKVPDATVLRVMTKWAEQLRKKLKNARQQIKYRAQLFKDHQGNLIELTPLEREFLYNEALKEEKKIQGFYEQLELKYFELGAKLLVVNNKVLYGDQQQGNIGVFSARVQTAIGKYMLIYINQLIKSLILLPKNAAKSCKEYYNDEKNKEEIDQPKLKSLESEEKLKKINLISLKISDLMRARFTSDEESIISVYQNMVKFSAKYPNVFRIVRLKNRLDQSNNDLLINFFFMNKILCELQMNVSSSQTPKEINFNNFNHFVYELKRSQFGVIAECSCVMAQYDPLTKSFTLKDQLGPQLYKANQAKRDDIELPKKRSKQQIKYTPYICDCCGKFERNNNPDFFVGRKVTGNYQQCNKCYRSQLENINRNEKWMDQLLRGVNQDQIWKYSKLFTVQNINEFDQKHLKNKEGLFLSINARVPKLSYYKIIQHNQEYILTSYNSQDKKTEIITKINTFSGKWKKQLSFYIFLKLQPGYQIATHQGNLKVKNCQKNKYQLTILSRQTEENIEDQTKFKDNKEVERIVRKKQKQTFYIGNRSVTTQLNQIKTEIKNVKRLYAFKNQIQSIDFINKMTSLEMADFENNKIKEIHKNVAELQKLEILKLSDNQIEKIQNLNQSIKHLQLRNNNIVIIQNMGRWANLLTLNLNTNKIKKITGLEGLLSLTSLSLDYNWIKDIEGLNDLKSLESLSLVYNQIKEIRGLQNLSRLKTLKLYGNQIKKIQGLEQLKQLKTLYLCNEVGDYQTNQITDIIEWTQTLTAFIQVALDQKKLKNYSQIQTAKFITLLNKPK